MDSETLIDRLKENGRIKSEAVEQAFRQVDRAVFVPEDHKMNAYQDTPLPIGEQETISAPHMVAINTELLEVEQDNRVVEVGSGSGYQVAILAELADEVIGVELNEELVEKSRHTLNKIGLENVKILQGSGLDPVKGDFDRILFSCAVSQEIFENAKNRLTENGILVAPVSENGVQRVKKFRDGETTEHGRVRFVSYRED